MPTDTPMQLGMIGLGRMGANLVRRLMRDGHHCVGIDVNADAVTAQLSDGILTVTVPKSEAAKPRTVEITG